MSANNGGGLKPAPVWPRASMRRRRRSVMKVPGALPGFISGRNDRPVPASGMAGE